MRLLKMRFSGFNLFEDSELTLDFFASDRVAEKRGVAELSVPIYSNTVVAFAGINATGKTTSLKLVLCALNILCGRPLMGEFRDAAFSFADERVCFEAIFWHEGGYYCLSSQIVLAGAPDSVLSDSWKFEEETLWRASSLGVKGALKSFDDFRRHAQMVQRRGDLSEESLDFLSDDTSMVTALTRGDGQYVPRMLYQDRQWLRMADWTIDGAVLKVFDDSIESCRFDKDEDEYCLSFETGASIRVGGKGDSLAEFLSDGTIKGANLVRQALSALQTGGYLLVDEVENHLNKQLVGLIIDLFESDETNPRGATLVFSTHYPEVLDFIKRKDNVYFFSRDDEHRVRAMLYSHRVKRIENKKSEVFLSNFLRGTAPKFSIVRDLKLRIAQLVGEGA